MRFLLILGLLVAPVASWAQQPQAAPPSAQAAFAAALAQNLSEALAQNERLQGQVKALEAAAKATTEPGNGPAK